MARRLQTIAEKARSLEVEVEEAALLHVSILIKRRYTAMLTW